MTSRLGSSSAENLQATPTRTAICAVSFTRGSTLAIHLAVSCLGRVTGKDQVASFGLIVAGEAGLHERASSAGLPS
jgi:hypothetical protein